MDAATWRIVLFIAVPWGIKWFGSWFNPAVVAGIVTIDQTNMRIANTTVKKINDVLAVNCVKNKVVTVTIDKPIITSQRAPILSKILPVIGDITPMTSAPGKIIKPDSSGVYPAIFCI